MIAARDKGGPYHSDDKMICIGEAYRVSPWNHDSCNQASTEHNAIHPVPQHLSTSHEAYECGPAHVRATRRSGIVSRTSKAAAERDICRRAKVGGGGGDGG